MGSGPLGCSVAMPDGEARKPRGNYEDGSMRFILRGTATPLR